MAGILLLLLVIAGPGPGLAAKAAAVRSHHRYLLQDGTAQQLNSTADQQLQVPPGLPPNNSTSFFDFQNVTIKNSNDSSNPTDASPSPTSSSPSPSPLLNPNPSTSPMSAADSPSPSPDPPAPSPTPPPPTPSPSPPPEPPSPPPPPVSTPPSPSPNPDPQDCSSLTETPGCSTCDNSTGGVWTCTSCAGSLLLLRNINACGCPPGTYNAAPDQCRDCPKGSFCTGGKHEGVDNSPAATSCAVYGPGLTTQGIRTTRKEGCVNLPGYFYSTVGPDSNPRATACPQDTFQVGLRKQRGCVSCPAGMTTANRTMQTNIGACDYNACLTSRCGKNMDCVDLPKPAGSGPEGRECKCVPGTTFVSELLGCSDPAETGMIGAPESGFGAQQVLTSFETRCPLGSFVVAISGIGGPSIQAIGPLYCSDGSGSTLVGLGQTSQDGKFTTRISPDGFTGMTVTASSAVQSVQFTRNDATFSATYGTMADVSTYFGRRQFITCPNFGVAIGLIGVRTVSGDVPVRLGLICSGLPCPVRKDSMFGPPGAPLLFGAPGSYLRNSPDPVRTVTATQCCGACTQDFRCQYWVRDDISGICWLIYKEPLQPGYAIPGDWSFQPATGYSSGATIPKVSGISVSGTYAGCFRDSSCTSGTRLKSPLAQNDPKMTVRRCLEMARLAGWPYAGLAPGTVAGTTSCFGGDKVPTEAVTQGCLTTCSGNFTERCGDNNCQVSVYSVLKPRWPLDRINRGDSFRTAGWFDVQCQGGFNDYCRWVGTDNSSYFSCAMAGNELPETAPGQVPEQFVTSTPCQELGYKALPQSSLDCSDVSNPRDNGCQTRQCCKAKCDSSAACTGFVFGNSADNSCRSTGDGQNCCWLKGGTCSTSWNPLTVAYQKTDDSASCAGYPPDPQYGVIFCPDNTNVGFWPQGTRCTAECKFGINNSDQKPYVICQSNGQWSAIVGSCKPECLLPPLLCPQSNSAQLPSPSPTPEG